MAEQKKKGFCRRRFARALDHDEMAQRISAVTLRAHLQRGKSGHRSYDGSLSCPSGTGQRIERRREKCVRVMGRRMS